MVQAAFGVEQCRRHTIPEEQESQCPHPWHPELSSAETEALEFIYDTRNKFDSGRIEEIDSSWIRDGKPLTSEDYDRSRTGVGAMFANLFK